MSLAKRWIMELQEAERIVDDWWGSLTGEEKVEVHESYQAGEEEAKRTEDEDGREGE